MGSSTEEIRRLENRSLDYLKYFTLLWSALIFFIIREYKQYELTSHAIENLWKSFSPETIISVDSLTVSLFLMLIILAVFCLWSFALISFPKYMAKDELENSLKEKESKLKTVFYVAIGLTPIYVLYLFYLLLLSNDQFRGVVEAILGISFSFHWGINMIFTPLLIIFQKKGFTFLKKACAVIVISPTALLILAMPVYAFTGDKFIFWLSLIGFLFLIALLCSVFLLSDTKNFIISFWKQAEKKLNLQRRQRTAKPRK